MVKENTSPSFCHGVTSRSESVTGAPKKKKPRNETKERGGKKKTLTHVLQRSWPLRAMRSGRGGEGEG